VTGSENKLAVVVFQLGGPDSLQAVEPFLYNLFSDADIIDFPFARLARPTLARLISSRRARHVREHYASIGGKSPIRELTELQARALEREIRDSRGLDARVFVAMRYWHPLAEEAVAQIARGNFHELILLPLYPQFSKTTTGSSLNEWQRQYARAGKDSLPTSVVNFFYGHPTYLDAVVEKVNEGLTRFAGVGEPSGLPSVEPSAATEDGHQARAVARVYDRRLPVRRSQSGATDDVHRVFSAHGVPVRVIEAGDPYQQQIEETVRLVMERGGWRNPHVLCYQSRVRPGKWLEPTLSETLRGLAVRDVSRVLVIPISFVTDHVETLAEIDIEARALARHLGVAQFELMPALNDSPTFIRALADLVLAQVRDN
jgi:ferrochelatase